MPRRHSSSFAPAIGERSVGAFWNYRGRLLVVMPNGYGTYHDGRSVAREQRILEKNSAPNGPLDIARASEGPVLQLAADKGVKLTPPPVAAAEAKESNEHRGLAWLGVGALLLVAVAAVAVVFVRRRRRPAEGTSSL
jgi:hypothetical protein